MGILIAIIIGAIVLCNIKLHRIRQANRRAIAYRDAIRSAGTVGVVISLNDFDPAELEKLRESFRNRPHEPMILKAGEMFAATKDAEVEPDIVEGEIVEPTQGAV